jgi:glycosyltransferase involved in cell wall biosynthesis
VLEAMAMARPVVAASDCVAAIDTVDRPSGLVAASTAQDYVRQIDALLASPEAADRQGAIGRDTVLAHYSWNAHMRVIDGYLPGADAARGPSREAVLPC